MAELDNAAFEMGAPELESVQEAELNNLRKRAGLEEKEGDDCSICFGRGKIDAHSEDGPSKCQKCKGTGKEQWRPEPTDFSKFGIGEAEEKENKTITVNAPVALSGDSIWDNDNTNPKSVNVTEIEVVADDPFNEDDTYASVNVKHDGPWTIYTDTGFQDEISKIVGFKVSFTEQGMQEEGVASMEGDTRSAVEEEIDRMKHLAGMTIEEADMPDFDKGERPRNSKERAAYRKWKKDSAAGAKDDSDVVSISPKDKKDAEARPANAAAANPTQAQFTDINLDTMKVDGKSIPSKQRAKSIANQIPDNLDLNDPAVKKEAFLKFTAKRPDLMFGEINARLSNDDTGLALSDRLSPIVRKLEDSRNIMELDAEDKAFALKLLQSAITGMELVKSTDIDKQIEVEPMQMDADDNDDEYDDDSMVPVLDTDDEELVRDSVNFDSIRAEYDILPEGKMKDIIQDAMDMSREEFDAKWKGEFDYDQLNKDYNDDLEEGKLPAGLQAYQDKKNGKKDDADKDDEEVDEDKEDKEEVDEALEDIKRLAGIEIAEGAKIDCPCCKGGKDSCSTGKDVCGTCDGTGKVDEAYEAVVETVADEMVENTIDLAMKELRQLAGI